MKISDYIVFGILFGLMSGCDYTGNAYVPDDVVSGKNYLGVWRNVDAESNGSQAEYLAIEMAGGVGIFNNNNKEDIGFFGTVFNHSGLTYLQLQGDGGRNTCLLIRREGADRIIAYGLSDNVRKKQIEFVRESITNRLTDRFSEKIIVLDRIKNAAQQVDSAEAATND